MIQNVIFQFGCVRYHRAALASIIVRDRFIYSFFGQKRSNSGIMF
jgi:hypothetical protein